MASIQSLPGEIVEMIAYLLRPTDCESLRSTCRQLEAKSYNCFKVTRFSSRTCIMTRPSLQRLLDLSTTRFGSQLKHLEIRIFHHYPRIETTSDAELDKHELKYRPYMDAAATYYLEQQISIREGRLQHIFKTYPSLQSLSIEKWDPYDHALTVYRYGQPLPETITDDGEDECHSFASPTVLAAALEAGIRLRSLKVNVWEDYEEGLVTSLNVREDCRAAFDVLTSEVETLVLYGRLRATLASLTSRYTLPSFVAGMTKLHSLDLHLARSSAEQGVTRLLKRCFFPNLEELKLRGICNLPELPLYSFISKHCQTLRRLYLGTIYLQSGDWRSFFNRLRNTPLSLEYVTVRKLYVGTDSDHNKPEKIPDRFLASLAAEPKKPLEW